jgi:hypothetical protein
MPVSLYTLKYWGWLWWEYLRGTLGRPRRRREDKIRADLQEVGCGIMDRIELVKVRDRWRALVNAVMNLRVSENAGNLLTSC